jgi:ribonuclease Z
MRETGIPRRAVLQMSLGAAVGALSIGPAKAADADRTARVADANATVDLNRKGLQIAITGSGSALPDPFRGGASCALIIDGKVLQFDFGRQVMENLMLMGVSPMRIDDIYFTHLHFDHINDYDYYATASWLSGLQKDVRVYGPPGTKFMSDSAITGMHKVMYDHIRAMRTRPVRPLNVRPEPPFLIEEVTPGLVVENDSYKVTCARVPHTGGDVLSLGYRIESRHGVVAISGDTGPSDAMVELGRNADVMLHELAAPDYGMTTGGSFSSEAMHNKDQVAGKANSHSTPTGLGTLAAKANVKMLVPYHLPPYGSVPAAVEMSSLYYGRDTDASVLSRFVEAIAKSYSGKVVLAQDRMILTVA